MRHQPRFLINTSTIELWPGGLLRARSNADARLMARARMVLRRKRDGRYLAAVVAEGIQSLMPRWSREPGVDEALDRIDNVALDRGLDVDGMGTLPLDRLHEQLDRLGLDESYAGETGLQLTPEPAALAIAGFDRYRRPLWLTAGAARAWTLLKHAAAHDDVVLEAISGYRSHDYQLGIFERKLARGQDIRQILSVNAAPGYSEHHDGNALDIGAPGEPPAEESFEAAPAFAWLQSNAGRFGFHMSYPRDNRHGIVYEPWHWYYTGEPV